MNPAQQVENLILGALGHAPTDDQRQACRAMVGFLYSPDAYRAFLLRGYAGTGKTSLVASLIRVAPRLRINTVLLAPTGRAAKVLSSYAGRRAYTIHKKIYVTVVDAMGVHRMVRARNKHSYTLFIVDEASMIGIDAPAQGTGHSLLEDLIDYVVEGNHCRLMLIGDAAQLPPVGMAESPALDSDYLESMSPLHVDQYEMTTVVRQQNASGMLHNATLVRQTLMQPLVDAGALQFQLSGFTDVIRLSGADLEETLHALYSENSPEEVVVVTRSNKRANLFNEAIRSRILFREGALNAGDLLMVVHNNYYWVDEESEMGFIANGDVAEVLSVRKYEELYGFHFVNASLRFVDYPDAPTIECKLLLETLTSESPSLTSDESQRFYQAVMEDYADIPSRSERMRALHENPYYNALQVKFAYALTCHKTQGGQWKTVIVDQGYLTDEMLDVSWLRWLYTALTRSTHHLYLLNFDKRFYKE
ncbi:MAG: AAA family ATPase [Bacteroidales bacterium]|nr:AAA family ATPase [Bacteroidales bacterium]